MSALVSEAFLLHYKPGPVEKKYLITPDDKERTVYSCLSPLDKEFQQKVLVPMLRHYVQQWYSPVSHGGVPGKSVTTAITEINGIVKSDYHWVLKIDFKQCYDNVPWHLMEAYLRHFGLPELLVQCWMRCHQVRFRDDDGRYYSRQKGLYQGIPVAPDMLNLLFTPLDRFLEGKGYMLRRFQDDLWVFFPSKEMAEFYGQTILELISSCYPGMPINEAKTQVQHVTETDFLGYTFGYEPYGKIKLLLSSRTIEKFQYRVNQKLDIWDVEGFGEAQKEIRKYILTRRNALRLTENTKQLEFLDDWLAQQILERAFKQRRYKHRLNILRHLTGSRDTAQQWATIQLKEDHFLNPAIPLPGKKNFREVIKGGAIPLLTDTHT